MGVQSRGRCSRGEHPCDATVRGIPPLLNDRVVSLIRALRFLPGFASFRLIQHAKYLLIQTDESLCLRIMHALKSMVKSTYEFDSRVCRCLASARFSPRTADPVIRTVSRFLQGHSLRLKLLRRYFADDKQYLKSLHQPLRGSCAMECVCVTCD